MNELNKITTVAELNAAISLLASKQVQQEKSVKEQFNVLYESLKPLNFIKSTLKELVEAPDFKDDALNTSISLITGYLSKKVAFGSSKSPVKQMLGSILQMGITSVVSRNADDIKARFMAIYSTIFEKKESHHNHL